MAHADVVERLFQRIHRHVIGKDARRGDQVELGILGQVLGLLERHRRGEMGFTGLQHRGAGIVVGDRAPDDRIDLGQAWFPVILVAADLHIVGLLPLDEFERAGADRIHADLLAVLGQRSGRNHRRRGVRELVDEGRKRPFQGDAHGAVVDHHGVVDVREQIEALEFVFRIGDPVEHQLDRRRVEIGAIVELDALLQLEGIDQPGLGGFIAVGQLRHHLQVLVEGVKPLVEGLADRQVQRRIGVIRVERSKAVADGEDGRLVLRQSSLCTAQGDRDCQGRLQQRSGQKFQVHRFLLQKAWRRPTSWRATKC